MQYVTLRHGPVPNSLCWQCLLVHRMAAQPRKQGFLVDSLELAEQAIHDLYNTHDGVLAIDLEGDLSATGRLSLGMVTFIRFCTTHCV